MTQRVDVHVDDGSAWLNQLVTNQAMRAKVWEKAAAGRHVTISPAAPPAPKPTPAPNLAARAQRIVFFANVTQDAINQLCALGPPWKAAFSADIGVYTPSQFDFDACHAHGIDVYSWCDCRNAGEGTPAYVAQSMAAAYHLDGWIGQAETQQELVNSVGITASGTLVRPQATQPAQVIIANPNEWTTEQRLTATNMIAAGKLAVTGECYRINPGYSSQGVPVASITIGVAMDAGTYYPYTEYAAVMPAGLMKTNCVWHGSGLEPEAWSAMRGA